jgi:hypothetical protein
VYSYSGRGKKKKKKPSGQVSICRIGPFPYEIHKLINSIWSREKLRKEFIFMATERKNDKDCNYEGIQLA